MSLGRREYRALADIIAEEAYTAADESAVSILHSIAERLAIMCKQDNARFSYPKFYKECGLEMPEKFRTS